MKVTISIIDKKSIEHLVNNSGKTISIAQGSVGFVAYVDGSIVGFSMVLIDNNRVIMQVLNVYNKYRRCGIGKRLLSEVVRYSKINNLLLFARFKVQERDSEEIKQFYVSQGYNNIILDDTEYFINIADWNSIFGSEYKKNENYSYRLLSELTNDEIREIKQLCVDELNDSIKLHPYSYESDYTTAESLYVIGSNGEVYGWIVSAVSEGDLNVRCVYIIPAHRALGVWMDLLQYMSSSSYLKVSEKRICRINFHVSSDNSTMNKFIKTLLNGVNHIVINNYIITLSN